MKKTFAVILAAAGLVVTQAYGQWVDYDFTVVPTGPTTTLTFSGYNVPSWIALDDVSVTTGGGPNLVANPSFATGDTTGWTVQNASSGSDWYVGAPGHTDGDSFNFGATAYISDVLTQTVLTPLAGSYDFNFWIDDYGYPASYLTADFGSQRVLTIIDPQALPTVPDGGSTCGLLGLALVGVGALRRKLS